MKNSLFRKYFTICSMCVLTTIVFLGAILMAFASRYFEQDKYDLLERSVRRVATETVGTFHAPTGKFNPEKLELIYRSLSTSIEGEFWLTDLRGNMLYWNEEYHIKRNYEDHELPIALPASAVNEALDTGMYKETGTLGGIYVNRQYIVGVPVQMQVMNTKGEVVTTNLAVLFVASPAEMAGQFARAILKLFLLSSTVVLIIAFVLIYFITAQMVKPLKEMLAATHSFSKGDFTKRVPVAGYDELGQLSMAFNNMASTLATTESSRRSFVANVSHELKTPMTTIGGFVDGILDGTVPEEKRNQYLMVVSSEVKRLSRLIKSMLDTARIEAGELSINPVLFDISELNRQTVFTFEQMITEKNLNIEGLEIDKVMVYADRDLLNQVIYNLVENAVKFVNENGTISFHYRSDNVMAYFAIRNTGEGLENEEIPRLFDRFYKSDKSRSLNKNGVGLGLHIVRSIINYHHGEVVVRSVPGEFTEFEIAIPNIKRQRE